MSLRLYFPMEGVISLLHHVHASSEHEPSESERAGGLICDGALVWVSDGGGVYLMSGGLPSLLSDPDDQNSNVVVRAHGWDPDDDHPYTNDTVLGGDDFAEHLHTGDIPLEALIRRHADGHRWFVLAVADADTVIPGVARELPDDIYHIYHG
ncbi:DUF3085 domain-containing protein [Catellatospora citrea]|uniref:DUF3085 domain-containing protein n=1 Tax=Catellatospora citrea TaxID=53366 RepID=UPI003409D6B7